jgi:hypothetical protein
VLPEKKNCTDANMCMDFFIDKNTSKNKTFIEKMYQFERKCFPNDLDSVAREYTIGLFLLKFH